MKQGYQKFVLVLAAICFLPVAMSLAIGLHFAEYHECDEHGHSAPLSSRHHDQCHICHILNGLAKSGFIEIASQIYFDPSPASQSTCISFVVCSFIPATIIPRGPPA